MPVRQNQTDLLPFYLFLNAQITHTKTKKYLVVNLKLDLCNSAMPDERAIMTYVSSYYHCFAGKIKVNLAIHSTDHNWCRPYHFLFLQFFFIRDEQKGPLTGQFFRCCTLFFSLGELCQMIPVYTAWVISIVCFCVVSRRFHASDCAWHVPCFLTSLRHRDPSEYGLVNGITMSLLYSYYIDRRKPQLIASAKCSRLTRRMSASWKNTSVWPAT